MSDIFTFNFPMPPNLGNARMHWAVKHKKKTAFWQMADLLVAGGVFPKPPKKPWGKAKITASCVVGAINDTDNLMARMKWIGDFLTTRGYIVDDKPKHLEWSGMPTQRVSRKNLPEVLVTLERLDD